MQHDEESTRKRSADCFAQKCLKENDGITQAQINDSLSSRIDALEAKYDALEAKYDALKAEVAKSHKVPLIG